VCFANINDEERHLIAKTLIQGFQVPSLGTEGGSGKAPKDKGNRFMVTEPREAHAFVAAEPQQCKVWSLSADRWGVGLALGNECHHRGTPLWVHTLNEGLQPLPVRRREVLLQHV